jgi:hypothetical protein
VSSAKGQVREINFSAISLIYIINNRGLVLILGERTIPITNSHKHLGVTFSSDAKWNIHVENILLSIYKHLNVLRKLK